VKKQTVAGHPRSKFKEPMADGIWPDKRDKVFDSTKLLDICYRLLLGGTGLADNGE
jgi:hypothetical protein